MKQQPGPAFSDYFDAIMKRRKFVGKNVLIVTVTAIIISLLLQSKYTATATILPPNPNQDMIFGMLPTLSYGSASGFSGLAKLSGMVSGVSTPSELYSVIMKSSNVKNELMRRFNLMEEFKTKTLHDTHKRLDEITDISISPEGIIIVSVTYENKYLATDMANAYVEVLDKFNTETAMTVGKRYRIFIEERLRANEDSLAKSEESLQTFQEEHRTVAIDAEIEAAIATIAQLKSQIIMYEVQRGAWSAAGETSNPYLYKINTELKELRKQLSKIEFGEKDQIKNEFGAGFSVPLSKLPEVTLEYARLFRDVKVQEAIYELLIQQYEQAKMMEVKDTPTIQFLDHAYPPDKRSFPKRRLIVVFAFLLSLFCSIPLVFYLEYIEDARINPQKHHKFAEFTATCMHDFDKLRMYLKSKFKK